jgi:hypothetical protein
MAKTVPFWALLAANTAMALLLGNSYFWPDGDPSVKMSITRIAVCMVWFGSSTGVYLSIKSEQTSFLAFEAGVLALKKAVSPTAAAMMEDPPEGDVPMKTAALTTSNSTKKMVI